MLALWERQQTFAKSLDTRASGSRWTFYEGPPTANGLPGTHHVEARVFKDVFPRFRTMQGYHVERKAGWDCHGLPVELAVEKELGFNGKPDIEAYGMAEFNARCRESVLRHVDVFEEMTQRMGYWVDLRAPYRTMDPEYVESVWWALKQIFEPGSAGRGLPRRPVLPALRHRALRPRARPGLRDRHRPLGLRPVPADLGPVRRYRGLARLLVWTTTPWTLVSNALVAAKADVTYVVRDRRATRPSSSPSRWSSRRSARAGDRRPVPGSDLVGWAYQRPFELVELPAPPTDRPPRALRRHRGLRHHRGRHRPGAPVARLRCGRLRSSAATACAMVNPIDATGHFDDVPDLVAGVLQARRRRPGRRPRRRAGCCSGTRTTSTPTRTAGAATRR